MDKSELASSIVSLYKFKEYISDLAKQYSIENTQLPIYKIDYDMNTDSKSISAKTELGTNFLAFIIKTSQEKVESEDI